VNISGRRVVPYQMYLALRVSKLGRKCSAAAVRMALFSPSAATTRS
jgi:hypothetical protein